MGDTDLTEKQLIEKATAEAFLSFYNQKNGSCFVVKHVADDGEVPDVFAVDVNGDALGIEVTLTEDYPGDVAQALGRRSSIATRQKSDHVISRDGVVIDILLDRIQRKLYKDYGNNVALVVRETGVIWDWDEESLSRVGRLLSSARVPFDRGIWLISSCKSRLYCLLAESTS